MYTATSTCKGDYFKYVVHRQSFGQLPLYDSSTFKWSSLLLAIDDRTIARPELRRASAVVNDAMAHSKGANQRANHGAPPRGNEG